MNILRRVTLKWPCENLIAPIGLRFVEMGITKRLENKVKALYAEKEPNKKKSGSIGSSGIIEHSEILGEQPTE
jgi:hypothetical protein